MLEYRIMESEKLKEDNMIEEQRSRGQDGKPISSLNTLAPCGRGQGEGSKSLHKTLSRICKFAFCSLTNSTLSQRERVNNRKTGLPRSLRSLAMTKAAFTLAEVLITLGIIGVVAALTLPNLIANYQKKQAVIRLKKVYSVINQAYNLSIAENGPAEYWAKPDGDVTKDAVAQYVRQYWLPYFKSVQTCSKTGNCATSASRYTMSGTGCFEIIDNNRYTIILADGTIIAFVPFDYNSNIGVFWGAKQAFYIDVNGDKKPNIAGKDSWVLEITDGKLRGAYSGYGKSLIENNCVNGNGQGCASLIINNAWVMPDDYPWK